tara:strand:- start:91 stop:213 length:123 start_codon:yes stop_codon:yes gene_type:complete
MFEFLLEDKDAFKNKDLASLMHVKKHIAYNAESKLMKIIQ